MNSFHIISIVILFLIGITVNVAHATTISLPPFDNATYFSDHSFRLTVTNTTAAQQGIQTVYVLVTSPLESGYRFPLDLANQASGTYQSPFINFTTQYQSSNVMLKIPQITSPETALITAYYPPVLTSAPVTATIIDSNYGNPWPPTAMLPLPLWGKKVVDCSTYGGDADKDGICDNWEIPAGNPDQGLKIPYFAPIVSPVQYYKLPCGTGTTDPVCPGNDMPDVYVELDWMKGHAPDQSAINDVVNAFAKAPVKTCVNNVCKSGIRLHVMLGEEIPYHRDSITAGISGGSGQTTSQTEFDAIKAAYFGTPQERNVDSFWNWQYNQNLTSKKQVFHYALFAHSQTGGETSSGMAEQPGNDLIISLGRFTGAVGSHDQQEGTFMHEIGHNLNLTHGGNDTATSSLPDPDNCKPNYLSIMSYSRQFNESFALNRPLDYSHNALPKLNEAMINETKGIGLSTPYSLKTVYGITASPYFLITTADNTPYQKLLWLPFENNILDSSGNQNNLHVNGQPNYIAGRVGNSANNFTGSTWIDVTNQNNFNLNYNTPFSISFWINEPKSIPSAGIVISKQDTSSNTYTGWSVIERVDGTLKLELSNNFASGASIDVKSSTPLNDARWHQVVITYDGSGTAVGVNFYIDGVPDTPQSLASSTLSSSIANNLDVNIGSRNGGNNLLTAAIDELQVWNSILSSSDTSKLLGGQHGIIDANANNIIDSQPQQNRILNKLGTVGCDGTVLNQNTLTGFDDWSNLLLNSKNYSSWTDGVKVFPKPIATNIVLTSHHASNLPHVESVSYSTTKQTIFTGHKQSIILTGQSQQSPVISRVGIFEYQMPHDPNATRQQQLQNWLGNYSNILIHNNKYDLPPEITLEDLREFRSLRIHSINYNIQTLPNSTFNQPDAKSILNKDLTDANNYVNGDDLYDSKHKLLDVRDNVNKMLIDPYVKPRILSQINDDITSLTIASTIYNNTLTKSTPNETLTFDKKIYHSGDTATVTFVSPSSNTQGDKVDILTLKVNSTSDQNGIKVPLIETGTNTGVFIATISTSQNNSDPTVGMLKAGWNDKITAKIGTRIATAKMLYPITIELDKAAYSWTDRVYITITAPSYNVDPNLVDEIGNSSDSQISISTNDHKLNSYKLVETGVDTGIFTGYVILTGYNYDATGTGVHPSSITSGENGPSAIGPTNGFIADKNNDMIKISFKDQDQSVNVSAPIKWNNGEIKWLATNYAENANGILQVIDPDMNLNPKAVDNLVVNIWSDSDVVGTTLTLTETGTDTGIFQGTASFSSTLPSAGNRLNAKLGDIVTAEYKDRTPYDTTAKIPLKEHATAFIGSDTPFSTTSTRIVDGYGNPVTTPTINQPVQVTAHITNHGGKDQPFTYLVEIQNADGVNVAVSWISSTLAAGQSLDPEQEWTPTAHGTYTVNVYVWASIDNPSSLSNPAQTIVTVN